ncbi:MAG: pentapeptide repeat-containing protein [Caulobacter sp.]
MKDCLDPPEEELCQCVKRGEPARLAEKRIDARVIRQLLLGLPPCMTHADRIPLTVAGVELHGATIVGRLHLDNMTGVDGAPLPSLVFQDCRFEGGLSATHAHLGRLSLRGCRFEGDAEIPTLDLTGAQLATDIDLSETRSTEQNGLFWVGLRNARIDGDLNVWRARFKGPGPAPESSSARDQARCGFDLESADIAGSVEITQSSLLCGLRAKNAAIGGDVWLTGSTFTAYRGDGINLQSAHIKGNLMLTSDQSGKSKKHRALVIKGTAWLLGVQVDGGLHIFDADIRTPTPAPGSPRDPALVLDGSRIGGSLVLASKNLALTFSPNISLARMHIEKSVEIGSLILHGKPENGTPNIDFRSSNILGDLEIYDTNGGDHTTAKTGTQYSFTRIINSESEKNSINTVNISYISCKNLKVDNCHINTFIAKRSDISSQFKLGLRKCVKADLTEINIGGSLDISNFEFASNSNLCLKDADIKRALRVKPKENPHSKYILRSAYEIELQSIPGFKFVQAHWFTGDLGKSAQSFHLVHDEDVVTLDGHVTAFQDLRQKIKIDTDQSAVEFLRLFCGMLQAEDGLFRIVSQRSELPPGVGLPEERQKSRRNGKSKDALPNSKELKFDIKKEDEAFEIGVGVLYGDHLFRSTFRIPSSPGMFAPIVDMIDDECISPRLVGWNRYINQRQVRSSGAQRPLPPLLPDMVAMLPGEQKRLASKLLRGLVVETKLNNTEVDLRDVLCDTLEDAGGAAWENAARLQMDRFTYRQIASDDDQAGPRRQKWRTPLEDEEKRFNLSALLPRKLMLAIHRKTGWFDYLIYAEDRRNTRMAWLRRQYTGLNFRKLPPPHEYVPQPFEQIINASRAAGDEEAAVSFEVEKIRIETWLFDLRTRPKFVAIGAAAGLAAGTYAALNNLAPTWVLLIWLAATLGTAFIVSICQFLFSQCFGYLRIPWRAFVTLCFSVLFGYVGVHLANAGGMMIVDMTPVATAASVVPGSNRTGAPAVSAMRDDVPCGPSIHELLYALDVFIPLIDLRQEDRCEVGDSALRPAPPPVSASAPANAPLAAAVAWLGVDKVFDQVRAWPRSTTFWESLKAIYAVIGWIVISLSILTFARATRQRQEN